MKAICNLDVPVDSKTPKYSSPTEEVPQGKNPGARSGLRRKQSSKHTSESTTEASKSQSGNSKKETKSSSAMDRSPNHLSPTTPMVGKMHKEAQQAAGGPTSLGDTSEEGAHPQLSSCMSAFPIIEHGMDEGTKNYSFAYILAGSNPSVLVDKTKSARDGLKTAPTTSGANEESRADDISRKVKLEDLLDILKDTRSSYFTPDSPTDDPIIVSDVSEEEENAKKDKDTEDTLVPLPPSPKSAQIQELMAQPSYPDVNQLTKLLLPSKITRLSGEIKELKQHIKDIEMELPGDLIEIPTKLEPFTSTISSLSSQVAELKNIHWKPPAAFLNLPSQVSSVQEKLKTLVSLPNLLYKVSDTLNRFSTMMENASGAASMNVPLAGQATPSPAEGDKNTKDACTNLKNELIDLLGKDVVTQYYTKKLLFYKYYDKMLKRKKNPKITNCEVLTKKGPITLKIYRKDGSVEVISNLKFSDLHSAEWRELTQTEQEFKIDLNQPLKEQDPLDELTDLANKKRKRTSDLRDHSSISASVVEVPSASSLQVLRKLGSIFTLVYAAVQKLKKDSWLELQFSLADSSILNVVYLLNRS
ncbi:hypothetical protein Tco_0382276 [Tanacetum coccineum]